MDTPRTDGAVMIVECEGRRVGAVHADLARDLERELAEGDARIKELEGIVSGKTMFDAADAAIKAERERISARIEALVHEPNRDENADQSYGYGLGIRAALSVIDKEGGAVGSGNQEEQ